MQPRSRRGEGGIIAIAAALQGRAATTRPVRRRGSCKRTSRKGRELSREKERDEKPLAIFLVSLSKPRRSKSLVRFYVIYFALRIRSFCEKKSRR